MIISKQFEQSNNYAKFLEITKGINVIYVKAGDFISVDKDLKIRILWPVLDFVKENVLNNNSIVAKVQCDGTSILFTGDIEEKAERRIVELYGETLKSDILKVAHHGSKSSSIQSFVDLVRPKMALIGVGANNTFGHPNDDVVARLKRFAERACIELMKWERLWLNLWKIIDLQLKIVTKRNELIKNAVAVYLKTN